MSTPALFLDRDGTLIVYKPYLGNPDDVELIEGSREALTRARDLGWTLFLFTNQSGVAREYFTTDDAEACNERMLEMLGLGTDLFDEIHMADEMPSSEPIYRKPSPRFIRETIAAYELDADHCYMVGDNRSDIQVALNAGIHPVAVGTGVLSLEDLRSHYPKSDVAFYPNLLTFVRELAAKMISAS